MGSQKSVFSQWIWKNNAWAKWTDGHTTQYFHRSLYFHMMARFWDKLSIFQNACFLHQVFVRREELTWHAPVCLAVSTIERDGVTQCDVCQAQFTDVRLFKEHYQMHTHPYRCDKCGKRFIKVSTYSGPGLYQYQSSNHECNSLLCNGKLTCKCDNMMLTLLYV